MVYYLKLRVLLLKMGTDYMFIVDLSCKRDKQNHSLLSPQGLLDFSVAVGVLTAGKKRPSRRKLIFILVKFYT